MRINTSAFVLFLLSVLTTFNKSNGEGQEFKLYRTSVDDWNNNNHVTKLSELLITEANSYCSSTPVQCSLPYWNDTFSFQRSDVVVSDGYPQEDVDLVIRFYIFGNFSSSVEELEVILSPEATREILLNIKSSLEDELGTYVTYIGEEFYGIPIDHEANKIIISVALGVLVIIAFVAIALTIWSKNQEKERNKMFSKKSVRMSRNANNRLKTKPEQHPDTENNLMKDNTDHQENKHLEHKHISPITNNQSHPSVSEASFLNDVKHRHNDLPPLNSAENGHGARNSAENGHGARNSVENGHGAMNSDELGQPNFEESDTSQMKRHHKKKRSKKKKKRTEEKLSHENSALEESESEIFTQSHIITNVQPNNVTAEESIV